MSEAGEKQIGIEAWILILKEAKNHTPSGERERESDIYIYIYLHPLNFSVSVAARAGYQLNAHCRTFPYQMERIYIE